MEHYETICRPQFDILSTKLDKISDRTGSIERKVYNGFEEKITNTNKTVDKLEGQFRDIQRRINALIITASGGAIGVIVTLWITLGG